MCISDFFTVSNGVRQGGILSPILFNVYMDDLSIILSGANIGCYINGVCFNHLGYADDSVIMAPSPSALQRLLELCNQYAKCNDIIFNTKKSFCMSFMPQKMVVKVPVIKLDGAILPPTDTHKYLGVLITSNDYDDLDINRQRRSVYARGNMLIMKFGNCSYDVKVQLFKTYCSSMYCLPLWRNYKASSLRALRTAYNNCFRFFMHLKRDCSVSAKFLEFNLDCFNVIRRKLVFGLLERINSSDNILISTLRNTLHFSYGSSLSKRWTEILHVT